MKLLLTNDDGIDARGLAALTELVRDLGSIVTVAPSEQQSAMGHRVTYDRPIQTTERGPDRIAVAGTPVDCARLALTTFAPDADWVLSGINHGGNLGVDVFMSGTVGAAREAAMLGKRAIALSQYQSRGRPLDWQLTVRRVRPVVEELLAEPAEPGVFWSINLPDPPHADAEIPWVRCPIDPSPLEVRYDRDEDTFTYAGDYHARPRLAAHDVDVCFSGRIAVSRLRVAH